MMCPSQGTMEYRDVEEMQGSTRGNLNFQNVKQCTELEATLSLLIPNKPLSKSEAQLKAFVSHRLLIFQKLNLYLIIFFFLCPRYACHTDNKYS